MNRNVVVLVALVGLFCLLSVVHLTWAESLKERNEILFREIQRVHGLSDKQMDSIRTIFHESGYIGQGNPAITEHPLTPQG